LNVKIKQEVKMYSIDLDLNREQVKQLKQLALNCDLPVRGLVTKLVITAIESVETKPEQPAKKQNKNNKEV
jgi:hypothetical protein